MLYLVSILTAPSILSDCLASAAASVNQWLDAFYPRKYSSVAFKRRYLFTDALRMFTTQDSLEKYATFLELVCSSIKRTFVGRISES